MTGKLVAVTFDLDAPGRLTLTTELGPEVEVVTLPGLDAAARQAVLGRATMLLSRNTGTELFPGEAASLGHLRLVQFLTAGVDFIPLRALPPAVPIASNGGAYAEPMANMRWRWRSPPPSGCCIEQAALTQRQVQPVQAQPHARRHGLRRPRLRRHRRSPPRG